MISVQAVALLRRDGRLADDPAHLWQRVMAGEAKKPNQQMEVVIALWREGLIR